MASVRILILLLLAGSVMAQHPISPRLDSMRIAVLEQLNMKNTGTPRITLNDVTRAINFAQVEVAQDFPAYPQLDTIMLSRSNEGGALPSNFDRLYSVFKKADTARFPMRIVPVDSLPLIFTELAANYQEKKNLLSPRLCWSFKGRLFVHPPVMTTQPDTFVVHYYGLPPRLSAVTDSCRVEAKYLFKVINYAGAIISTTRESWQAATWLSQWYEVQKRPSLGNILEGK